MLDLENIDPRFVDVDFEREAKHYGYSTGYAGPGDLSKMRSFGDVVPELSDSEIEAEIEKMDAAGGGAENFVTRIYDQNGEGSCVANACSQSNEIMQAIQFGKENVVHLSSMSLYKRIGSGPNSGANVSDGLDEMQAKGVLPLDNAENRARFGDKVMPNCGWSTRYPTGWEDVAKGFKVQEAYVAQNVRQLKTALLRRRPVVVGRAGHSICYVRLTKKGVIYVNSWRLDWGFAAGDFTGGFGLDTAGLIGSSAGWAFVLGSLIVPSWRHPK